MMRPLATSSWTLPLVRITGGLAALLGLTVLVGWHTHDLRLIHVLPGFVGMAYNTALGFLLCGVALLAAGTGRRRLAMAGGGLALLLGLLTLAEYLVGRGLGIDELFMRAYTRAGIVNSARMAFATALSFTLAGGALLGGALLRRPLPPAAVGLLGALVAGLGTVALSGYFTGITLAYTWGQFTRMAVHTAAGFIVLGGGLIALAGREDRDDATPRWLPGLVGIGAATATLCLWQSLIVQQSAERALITHLDPATRPGLTPLVNTQAPILAGALAGGLLLSALLAGAAALAQTARRQAAQLQAANAELAEIRAGLERRVQERTEDLAEANTELARANKALRDVLVSVTEGRFRLCGDEDDLPLPFHSLGEPILLTPTEGLRSLRHQALDAARRGGLTDERTHDLVTAVGEAAMNAVVHCGGGTGRVHLTAAGTVQVWVMDAGTGISLENLPRATLERGFTTAGTLGHGFWLMLNVIDRLWLLTGATGTTVVMEQDPVSPEPAWLREGRLPEPSLPAPGLAAR